MTSILDEMEQVFTVSLITEVEQQVIISSNMDLCSTPVTVVPRYVEQWGRGSFGKPVVSYCGTAHKGNREDNKIARRNSRLLAVSPQAAQAYIENCAKIRLFFPR